MSQRPSVARLVHYVSYGTPGGEYRSQCRAAVVTEVDGDKVGLAVLNPTGMFFHSMADGGVEYFDAENPPEGAIVGGSGPHAPGTWHWPERVGA